MPNTTDRSFDKMPGHWVLAKMGKRVLRPGGRELTDSLLSGLSIGHEDEVVEFAPGMGATAKLVFDHRPAGYTGIEQNEEAADRVQAMASDNRYRCVIGTAQNSGLSDGSASVVFGEAMLTMQSDENKQRIADEAFRILRPGGRYGMHELCLQPDPLDPETQQQVRGDLSRSIHVGARPLTPSDWRALLMRAGFEIQFESTAPMRLLEPGRMVKDEGLARTLKIVCNIARTPAARRRVRAMRGAFRRNADHLGAVAMVAIRPNA